jgi:hypothetical protein
MVMNDDWVLIDSHKGENFVLVTVKVDYFTFTIVSLYLPPEKARAKKVISKLGKALKTKEWPNLVLGGDLNCTESDSARDVRGGARNETFRKEFLKMVASLAIVDAELQSPLEDLQMTHWNHSHTKGSRIDRWYLGADPLEKCTGVGYAPFEYGDHAMRVIRIGDPPLRPQATLTL